MSTICLPHGALTIVPVARGRISPAHGVSLGAFRLPADPLFFADLTLENIVPGSRYRVTRRSDGSELATGVAASSTEVISGIPVYSNPMLVDIVVRKASSPPFYKPLSTAAFMIREGAISYIVQLLD